MRIVLTGAGGQLGREWIDWAAGAPSADVTAFTSDELDITRPEQYDRTLANGRPDVWVNCAAYTAVDKAEDEPDQARRINAEAPGYLARWCAEHSVKLVHYSTDYVFRGSPEDRIRYPEGYPEDAPLAPVNTYGLTKLEGEQAIRQVANQHGCDALILRVAWLCGAHGRNFVKTMLRLAAERDELRVVDDQIGCPAFAGDIVRQSAALLERDLAGTYHLGSTGLCSWHGFAVEILRLAGSPTPVTPVTTDDFPTRAARPRYSKLDTRAFEAATGMNSPEWTDSLARLMRQLNL
jgi:dTDP-4-dehydrorhamnose reductase